MRGEAEKMDNRKKKENGNGLESKKEKKKKTRKKEEANHLMSSLCRGALIVESMNKLDVLLNFCGRR
jgi:hypothetical protein